MYVGLRTCVVALTAVALTWAVGAGASAPESQGDAATATVQAASAGPQDPLSAGTFWEFRLRAVGPALMSGRIAAIAVHPADTQTWYIGVASGGVWKTSARDYQERVFRLQRTFTGALEQANQMRTRTQAIRRAVVESGIAARLLDTAVGFDRRVVTVLRTLRGNETLRGLESAPSSVQARVNSAAAGARGLTGGPTATQQQNYSVAVDEMTATVGVLRGLEAEIRKFEQELEAAGVPYTPGRWPGQ